MALAWAFASGRDSVAGLGPLLVEWLRYCEKHCRPAAVDAAAEDSAARAAKRARWQGASDEADTDGRCSRQGAQVQALSVRQEVRTPLRLQARVDVEVQVQMQTLVRDEIQLTMNMSTNASKRVVGGRVAHTGHA